LSSPTSLKLAPPVYVDPRIRRRWLPWYIVEIWLSLIPTAFLLYWFFYPYLVELTGFSTGIMEFSLKALIDSWGGWPVWTIFLLVPLYLTFVYVFTVVWTWLITRLFLGILKRLHPPKEGVFYRSTQDKDYLYWNRRNMAKIFLFWLLHSVPFTFLKVNFSYRWLDVPVGQNSVVNHAWIAPEFVSIGKNVVIGQAAGIYSFQFQDDKLLVAKIHIGDDVMIGPQTVIFPGVSIPDGVTIDDGGFVHPFTQLEANGNYHGAPAKLIRKDSPSDSSDSSDSKGQQEH